MNRALVEAYSPRASVPNNVFDGIMREYRDALVRAARDLYGHRDIAFDPGSNELLDVFGIEPGYLRPAILAIHGGHWRALSRFDTAFMADVLAERGVANRCRLHTRSASHTV